MTDHPCKGMSQSCISAFEQIATGIALPAAAKRSLDKLQAKGLIERGADRPLSDRLGKFSIPQYFVPLPVHMDWCEWCSEQPDLAEIGA